MTSKVTVSRLPDDSLLGTIFALAQYDKEKATKQLVNVFSSTSVSDIFTYDLCAEIIEDARQKFGAREI